MIDAYFFNNVIDGIRLVNNIKRIDRATMNNVKNWFLEFAEWSDKNH